MSWVTENLHTQYNDLQNTSTHLSCTGDKHPEEVVMPRLYLQANSNTGDSISASTLIMRVLVKTLCEDLSAYLHLYVCVLTVCVDVTGQRVTCWVLLRNYKVIYLDTHTRYHTRKHTCVHHYTYTHNCSHKYIQNTHVSRLWTWLVNSDERRNPEAAWGGGEWGVKQRTKGWGKEMKGGKKEKVWDW